MIENLVFDEQKHIYYINGKRKTSVSEILKIYDGIKYSGANPRTMFEAADRGSRVHEFTELYDCDPSLDVDEFFEDNQDIEGYCIAYLRFVAEYGNSFFAIEEPFYCKELDYCCTVDRIREIADQKTGKVVQAIVDFKTSSKLLNLRNRLQLTLYGIAVYGIDNYKNYSYYIVHLEKTGEFELVEIEPLGKDEITKFVNFYRAIKKD